MGRKRKVIWNDGWLINVLFCDGFFDCLQCLALTSTSRRFLQRRYDIRGEEESTSRHRCKERRLLRLLEMTWDWVKCNYKWNSVGFIFDGGFECCTARNLAYFCYCVFKEAVFTSSLYKVCCAYTRACITELQIHALVQSQHTLWREDINTASLKTQ